MLNPGFNRFVVVVAVGFFFGVWSLDANAAPTTTAQDATSATYSLVNGPFGSAAATGLYPGASGRATDMLDFTALKVPCLSNEGAVSNGLTCILSATSVIVINELDNTGSSSDVVKITASAPPGFAVRLYAATACSGGGSSAPRCTQGNALTNRSTNGGRVNAAVTMHSGAAYYYEAAYKAIDNSAIPYTAYIAKITAAGRDGAGAGADANDTYNILYPGGVVRLTNGVTATMTNCLTQGNAPLVGAPCRGAELRYTIAYDNVVPVHVALNLGTEPAFAYGPCYTAPGSFIITDDGQAFPSGAAGPNNWLAYTGDIAAAATDTTTNTVFTYFPSGLVVYSTGQTKFVAQIGGADYQLPPGASGTVVFTAIVK